MKGRTPLFRLTYRILSQAHRANLEESGAALPSPGRRNFLRLTAAAGASLLAVGNDLFAQEIPAAVAEPTCKPAPEKPETAAAEQPVDKGPVAIVGGGIAGLTAAYRLANKGVAVEIFEANPERLGGRMWTKRDFNKDGMFVELGGELVDTNHVEIQELAKELNIEIQPLREGEKGVEFYHFGGKRYTDAELIPAFQPLAKRIAEAAEGLMDDQDAYTEKAQKLDAMSLAAWLKANSEGVEKWVIEMLDVAYTCEFGLECDEQSSLNLIDFINPDTANGFELFGESDEAHRIKGGNQTLPDAVVKALEGKAKMHLGHSLTGISHDGKEFTLNFLDDGKKKAVQFAKVIMTIPFTILRDVSGWEKLPLSKEKVNVIKNLAYGTNVKLMIGFTEKFWRAAEPMCSGSTYTDLGYQTTWETSRGQDGNSGILTNFMGGKVGAQFGPDRIKKVVAELDKLFPGIKAKVETNKDKTTLMVNSNWPKIKFVKASYSLTGPGQYCSFYETAALPEMDGNLIFAGEHTSIDFPAYMNGGVQSGNRAARIYLGEPEPEPAAEEPVPAEAKPGEPVPAEAAKPDDVPMPEDKKPADAPVPTPAPAGVPADVPAYKTPPINAPGVPVPVPEVK